MKNELTAVVGLTGKCHPAHCDGKCQTSKGRVQQGIPGGDVARLRVVIKAEDGVEAEHEAH